MVNPEVHRDIGGNDPRIKRSRIAVKARSNPKIKFNNLIHHLTPQLIEESIKSISVSSVPGVDDMPVKQVRENLSWLLPPIMKQIHAGQYDAPAVRRTYIPKADGKLRPIGVPTVLDRGVQAATVQILNEIYEQDFLKCSFGYRQGIGCHHALATLAKALGGTNMNFVLEVDIRDFFGSLNHGWLSRFLELRISDKNILKLVDGWLKAGFMEHGEFKASEQGSPQGGSISPLLSNIYLHYVLDLWWEVKVKSQCAGQAKLIRYADDFVIVLSSYSDAVMVLNLIKARFSQFGLFIAEEKTHITDLTPGNEHQDKDRRHVTFLGFNIYRSINRKKTGWKVTYSTSPKRFTLAKSEMKKTVGVSRHWCLEDQRKRINAILIGHSNYYGLPGNTKRLKSFEYEVLCAWKHGLSRRSQNGILSWEQFNTKILKQYPVVKTKLKIKYGDLNDYVRL